MRATLTCLLVAVVLGILWMVCNGVLAGGAGQIDVEPWVPVSAGPAAVRDVEGQEGGVLTWAEVGEVGTFNPLVGETATEADLKSLVFDGLVSYDNTDWEFKPSLAWEWEHTDDWRQWTFRLRKGVVWSDGEPFSADDVVFTWNACTHPKVPNSASSGFKVGDHPYPTVKQLDDHTVQFDLPVVNALFLVHLSSLRIMPAHLWADTLGDEPTFPEQMLASGDLSDVVGTGPYRLTEYSGAERIVYERNPRYWQVDRNGARLPYTHRVIILLANDLSTRSVQFLNGDFDMITDIPPQDYARFRHDEAENWFELHRLGLSLNTNWISFNQYPGADPSNGEAYVEPHKHVWFTNRDFRRAMSHAVDRDKLVRLFVRGKGEAIYSQTNQGNKTWHGEPQRFEYDPERAGELLDGMGLIDRDDDGLREDADGNPVRFNLTTNVENPLRVSIIAQVREDWAAVGVDARISPVNFQELVGQLMDGHKWHAILLGWGAAVPPDPLNGKNILLPSGRLHVWHPQQETPANAFEARTEELILAMDQEPDLGKRKAIYDEYIRHESAEQPIIYLYSANAYSAAKTRVRNLRPSMLRPQTWHNVQELWLDDTR